MGQVYYRPNIHMSNFQAGNRWMVGLLDNSYDLWVQSNWLSKLVIIGGFRHRYC